MIKTKLVTLFASFVLAGAAHAVVFNFQSNGNVAVLGNTVSVNDPNLTQYTTGTTLGYTFVNIGYTYTANFAVSSLVGSVAGTGKLALKNPSNVVGLFDFAFSGESTRSAMDAGANTLTTLSFSQLAIALVPDAATPGFTAGLVGSGNFSGNTANGLSSTSFVSTFNPVPEPASLAALAVGALALIRRRRKA